MVPVSRAEFYINEKGAGLMEIFLITAPLLCLFLALGPDPPSRPTSFRDVIQSNASTKAPWPLARLGLRTKRLIVAVFVTLTLMPPSPTFQGLLIGLSIALGLLRYLTTPRLPSQVTVDPLAYYSSSKASLLILTLAAILGVDFPAFPRRYAKTNHTGTSLMDLGVGLYIVSYGSSSYAARSTDSTARRPYLETLFRSFKNCFYLLALGLARALAVKSTGYHEQVGEYGVHWNFFLTLASLSLLSGLLGPLALPPLAPVTGLLLLLAHQSVLSGGAVGLDLSSLVLSDSRPLTLGSLRDLVLLNKEGLFSLPGYLALYLLSLSTFRYLNAHLRSSKARKGSALGRLLAIDLGLWIAHLALDLFVERASRRSCNAAFVLWILAHALLAALIPAAASQHKGLVSGPLEENLSRSMLPLFLVGNLLTGLVNLTMDSIQIRTPWSWMVVGSYLFFLMEVSGPMAALLDAARGKGSRTYDPKLKRR